MIPKTVPDESDVTVTATTQMRHLCPHRDEVDRGTIAITWECAGQTIELHSLAEYLKTWHKARISHERLTDRIQHDLALPGIGEVRVESTWNTAAMEVRCSTSPTPVDLP